MAIRLIAVGLRSRTTLLSVPRPRTVEITRSLWERKNLTPFFDRPESIIFSTSAVMHHWGAIPIIVISILGQVLAACAWFRLAFSHDDVWWVKDGANQDYLETRQGPWYPAPNRKWKTYNQKYEYPPELIYAIQGDAAGPSGKSVFKRFRGNKRIRYRPIVASLIFTVAVLVLEAL